MNSSSPRIEYNLPGRNLGYGAGHNLALARSKGTVQVPHLILNPDVEFDPQDPGHLFDFMEQNTEVGLVMPKVLYRTGDSSTCAKTSRAEGPFPEKVHPGSR